MADVELKYRKMKRNRMKYNILYKYIYICTHPKHGDAQVLMFHVQLHASCTQPLADPAVESHFLGEHLCLLKLEIFFSFCAALFLNHYVLNDLSKKSGSAFPLLNRYIYFLELRKKTLCHWKPYCTTFIHDSQEPKFSQVLSFNTK